MKKVLIDPEIQVPGELTELETIIDPDVDVLSDEADPVEFALYERVEVVRSDFAVTGFGVVTRIHQDDEGVLVQVSVDWESFEPIVS